jgi:hypothetical protein
VGSALAQASLLAPAGDSGFSHMDRISADAINLPMITRQTDFLRSDLSAAREVYRLSFLRRAETAVAMKKRPNTISTA